jgi:hypothetical protein
LFKLFSNISTKSNGTWHHCLQVDKPLELNENELGLHNDDQELTKELRLLTDQGFLTAVERESFSPGITPL